MVNHSMRNRPPILFIIGLVISVATLGVTCQPTALNRNANASRAEQESKSPLPPPTGFVNDYSNVLDETKKSQLESTLAQLKERSAIEFAVVFVNTTEGRPIDEYSMAVARGWGIGTKDTANGGGLLLLVAVKDNRWRIEVSRSLEKDLPNEVALEIGRLMNEPFRQQKYGEGVTMCVDAIIARLAERRGFVMDRIERTRVETDRKPQSAEA